METKCLLNFADALPPSMIQVKQLHCRTTFSGRSFDLITIKSEVV